MGKQIWEEKYIESPVVNEDSRGPSERTFEVLKLYIQEVHGYAKKQVLLSHHGLSKKTVAAMAGVETKDIEKLLSNPPGKVSEETKYKIAVTVMSLRFFLKDCEPQI